MDKIKTSTQISLPKNGLTLYPSQDIKYPEKIPPKFTKRFPQKILK
jgi:hypothetical protein